MAEGPHRSERVLVLQSHRQPLPRPWLEVCIDSVKCWARHHGYDYRFEDDVLFERLDPGLRARTVGQPVIAADLARLVAIDTGLAQGADAVLWLDADTLLIDPAWPAPQSSYALGREVWIQAEGNRWRARVKVHNAFLAFRRDNPFLVFYRHAAERIVLAHRGPMAPQLVGPKLLTALHNLIACPVAERAAMLCPAVARDLLAGGGPALDLFRQRTSQAPASVNLCASLAGRDIDDDDIQAVIERLLTDRRLLAPLN